MLDNQARVLYVGKARSLKARVSNYARHSGHSSRIARMISETADVMVLTTETETEALLLEQNLIKQLKPCAYFSKSFSNKFFYCSLHYNCCLDFQHWLANKAINKKVDASLV